MANMTSQAVFPMWTGNARDVVMNTMHWTTDADPVPRDLIADEIADRLSTFYEFIYDAAQSAATYMIWTQARVEILFLEDPTPRVPEVRPLALNSPGVHDTNIPSEVAVCLSYHAAPESGTPRQRLYNRIYLGGLGNFWISSNVGASPTVSNAGRSAAAGRMELLAGLSDPALAWVQRSFTPVLTNRPIVGGWVDNEPDTQRRRGVDPGSKTFWP